MYHKKLSRELSQEITKKIIHKYIKGKGYKIISKQLHVPVTTVAHIIQKFKVHGTVANLHGRGRKKKIYDKFKRRLIQTVTKEPRTNSKEMRLERWSPREKYISVRSHHLLLFKPKWT